MSFFTNQKLVKVINLFIFVVFLLFVVFGVLWYWQIYLPKQQQKLQEQNLQAYQAIVNNFNSQLLNLQNSKIVNWLDENDLAEDIFKNQNLSDQFTKLKTDIYKLQSKINLNSAIARDLDVIQQQNQKILNFLNYRKCFLEKYLLVQKNTSKIIEKYQNLSRTPTKIEVLEIFNFMSLKYLENSRNLQEIFTCTENNSIQLNSQQEQKIKDAQEWYKEFDNYIQKSILTIHLNQPEIYQKIQLDLKKHSQNQPVFLQTSTLDSFVSITEFFPEIQQKN